PFRCSHTGKGQKWGGGQSFIELRGKHLKVHIRGDVRVRSSTRREKIKVAMSSSVRTVQCVQNAPHIVGKCTVYSVQCTVYDTLASTVCAYSACKHKVPGLPPVVTNQIRACAMV